MLRDPRARLAIGIATATLALATLRPAGALGAKPTPEFVFQDVVLAPFERSHTFVIKGRATPEGCV